VTPGANNMFTGKNNNDDGMFTGKNNNDDGMFTGIACLSLMERKTMANRKAIQE
jgi:hypothetical protein